jgi:hypothetical protein
MVRAKVAALASLESEIGPADRAAAADSARRHARLAAALAVEEAGPLWIAACGPPASGTSTLAHVLAADTGWPIVSSDVVRKEMLGLAPTAHAPAGAYAPEMSDRVYAEVLVRARAAAAVVLLDANWPTKARRGALVTAGRSAGARVVIADLAIPPPIARRRLEARAADPEVVSDADVAVYERLAAAFEPPTPGEGAALVHLDGTPGAETLVDALLAHLVATSPVSR